MLLRRLIARCQCTINIAALQRNIEFTSSEDVFDHVYLFRTPNMGTISMASASERNSSVDSRIKEEAEIMSPRRRAEGNHL